MLLFATIILGHKKRVTFVKLLLLIIIISSIISLLCYFNVTLFKTLIVFVLFALLIRLLYSLDISQTIIITFIYFVISVLVDIISINLFTLTIGEVAFYKYVAGKLLGSVATFIILTIITLIFRKLILKLLNIKIRYRMLFVMIFSIVCIIALFYATFRLGTNSADKLLCIFSIFVLVLVIGNSFMQAYKNNQLMLQYDNLLSFIKKYETEIDNQRMMRHETKNQLLTIKSKIIDKEKPTEIVDYIDTILNDDRKINILNMLS